MKRFFLFLVFGLAAWSYGATTWYIRPDGGTRYSANQPQGQCNGQADAAYPGSGVNQPCAFNDYRYLWDDQSYGNDAWVIAGGDTVIIRGGPWRVGFNQGSTADDVWCFGGQGPYACSNPTIPSGTASQPTRILGENYASCSSGNATVRSKLTQIFGGYGVGVVLNLSGAQYVQVECLEITRHSQCITHGTPAVPSVCSTSYPLSDYDSNGIGTNNQTGNVLLQDIWDHGHTNDGVIGPLGTGLTQCIRCDISTNGMAGWSMDDGNSTPNGTGAQLDLEYTTIEFSGCNQEYPAVDAVPVISCYDDNSGGYGDGYGTQSPAQLQFTCNYCVSRYNTQDAWDNGHVSNSAILVTNSIAYGNMGGNYKSGPNASYTLKNDVAIGNCKRMSAPMTGAPSTYNVGLSDFCRAAGDENSFVLNGSATADIENSTFVGYGATMFDASGSTCTTCNLTFKNSIALGYSDPNYNSGQTPGMWYGIPGPSVESNNLFYNLRNCPAGSGDISPNCSESPAFVNQPASPITSEAALDNFDYTPSSGSPAAGIGATVASVTPQTTATTPLSLSVSPNPATLNQAVTFTAVVPTAGNVAPTGVVTFFSNGTDLGSGSLNSEGMATYTTSTLSEGSHTVSAAYAGSASYPAETSGTLSLTVEPAQQTPTTTSVWISPSMANYGQLVTINATVKATSGDSIPTGTVEFMNGTTALGSAPLNASGSAALASSSFAAGTYNIVAQYQGDSADLGSVSTSIGLTVNPKPLASTVTSMAVSPNPVVAGHTVRLIATVKATSSSIPPTGQVYFLNGSTVLGSGTLDQTGKAEMTTIASGVGAYSLSAHYSGDQNYQGSVAPNIILTIRQNSENKTITSISVSPNEVTASDAIGVTATVKSVSGRQVSAGKIIFRKDGRIIDNRPVDKSGEAAVRISPLPAGSYSLMAEYESDENPTSRSFGEIHLKVNRERPSATITRMLATPSPATVGRSVKLTAEVKTLNGRAVKDGSVIFRNGERTIGVSRVNEYGFAELWASGFAAGPHRLTATYHGDSDDAASSTGVANLDVAPIHIQPTQIRPMRIQ